jgi:hypothetical protein
VDDMTVGEMSVDELSVDEMSFCHFCIFGLARKSEIIRSTELLLEAINNSDFESYAYVTLFLLQNVRLHVRFCGATLSCDFEQQLVILLCNFTVQSCIAS